MDLNPVYELQERLRSAAIAGANLLNEDFRLRRAAEAIKPLATASPVFAKLCQQMELLLSADCNAPAGVLLDTIALADAIICTLAAVETKSEIKEFVLDTDLNPEGEYTTDTPPASNAPYSQVKGLINALTTTGSRNFAFANDILSTHPEVFNDYRVKPALIQALGASYSEIAELSKKYLARCGTEIIPLLKKDFDPKGKKEMVHRINIIEQAAGASENDFYIEMLETATGDVRTALINALCHEPSNYSLLLDMAKKERGKNKQCVLNLLAKMENEQVYNLFKQQIKKSPVSVLDALLPVTTECASNVIAETCMEQLPKIIQTIEKNDAVEMEKKLPPFCKITETLVGKHGDKVCECYQQLLSNSKILEKSRWKPDLEVTDYPSDILARPAFVYIGENNFQIFRKENRPPKTGKFTWKTIIGSHIAQSLAVFPDGNLKQMAIDLYENNKKDINFLPAMVFIKILEDNNCTSWFDEQIKNDKTAFSIIQSVLSYIRWDKKTNAYVTDMVFKNISWPDERRFIKRKIEIPKAGEIKSWLMEQNNQYTDSILNRWIDKTDSKECEKAGQYFYNKAFTVRDNEDYIIYMLNCGWKKCNGLGTRYIKGKNSLKRWQIENYLFHLPGTLEDIHKEINAVIDIIKSGEIKIYDSTLYMRKLEDWFDILRNPSNYAALNLEGY